MYTEETIGGNVRISSLLGTSCRPPLDNFSYGHGITAASLSFREVRLKDEKDRWTGRGHGHFSKQESLVKISRAYPSQTGSPFLGRRLL